MKKRILIIDDDTDICALLQRFLSKNGYDVDTAHSGKKGIEKFLAGKYDIVLCDYRLGDKKDGKDILIEIKQHDPSAMPLLRPSLRDAKNRS